MMAQFLKAENTECSLGVIYPQFSINNIRQWENAQGEILVQNLKSGICNYIVNGNNYDFPLRKYLYV